MWPGCGVGEAGVDEGLELLAQGVGEGVAADFAIEFAIGLRGGEQVAVEGFFYGGEGCAGAVELFF